MEETNGPTPVPSRPVRSRDVAELAGVSRASVSRAFSGSLLITDETRNRVLAAAAQLGYRPNAIARSLIKGQSGIVGIVTAELTNPFYASVLDALCNELQRRDLAALVLVASALEAVDALVPKLLSYRVDGIVIAASTLTSQIVEECVRAERRIVLVNRATNRPDVASVSCDNVLGGRLVGEHLAVQGYSRPAFLAGSASTAGSAQREQGYAEGLRKFGLQLHANEVGNYSYAGGAAAAHRLLSKKLRPDAIFAANDAMALAVLDIAEREYGLRVPEDIGVVGFDNTPLSAASARGLTSVDQNVALMSGSALEILLTQDFQTRRGAQPRRMTPCTLEIRRSSDRSLTAR